MTPESSTIDALIASDISTIILFSVLGVVFGAVLLLRRAPSVQNDAFSIANGLLKAHADLTAEAREDGKRREAAAVAHVAALNAATDALRSIATQQMKDSAALGSITTAVTTQADARHREVMGAFDIHAGFYPAMIEELRGVKSSVTDLAKSVRRRKYGKPAPIRGALNRIEKQLEKITHDTTFNPALAYVRPPYFDWRTAISANPNPVASTNGHTGGGYDTNDA